MGGGSCGGGGRKRRGIRDMPVVFMLLDFLFSAIAKVF